MKSDYVLFTDGDIVYEKNAVFDYLLKNIEDNDILIQNDTLSDANDELLCSGFMFIKSNEKTVNIFDPKNIAKFLNKRGWDDQIYINKIKHKLKFKKLPLDLFPNGQYYYNNYINIEPYIIHFNWVVGYEKIEKMKHFSKWRLEN